MIDQLARIAYSKMVSVQGFELEEVLDAWEDQSDRLREDWRQTIGAVLIAMREPTQGMLDATSVNYPDASDVWRNMIDAALKDA